VPTLVCFHAHPDDEALTTGGTMARAARAGNRVVLVVATDGRHGEAPEGLEPGEALVRLRQEELARSAAALGVTEVRWLGYEDSGMTGWESNANPRSFLQADLAEAAERLAAILRTERADVLTTYDWHGNYGHPDHIRVHQVGHRAAELAGTPAVYEATINRDAAFAGIAEAVASGEWVGDAPDVNDTDDGEPFGIPEAELTTAVDVSDVLDMKRAAFAAHASQVTDTAFFLQMRPEVFRKAFGVEWFRREGAPAGIHEDWLAGLDRDG
jgi:LmbE family N-acetylglucosaminyl deacetylase